MLRGRRVFAALVFAVLALCLAAAPAALAKDGILLLAHGSHDTGGHGASEHEGHAAPNPWNDNVGAVVKSLDATYPTEVAFGMAEAPSIEAAVARLEKR